MSLFKKAVRSQAKLKLALTGPSGSGKTFSALRLASGLGKKIAVIDTENNSAALYADQFDFDSAPIPPPFTADKYVKAIREAIAAGYDVLVIDSLSHAWAGDGGLLAQKESLDARGGNSYTNWGTITKQHEAFKSAILQSPIHIIATMRSKQAYVLETNDKGKQAPRKVGLEPIQRDGMEYEFTTVFDIAMNHEAEVSKDRSGLFVDKHFQITEEAGAKLLAWLDSAPLPEAPAPDPLPTRKTSATKTQAKQPTADEQVDRYLGTNEPAQKITARDKPLCECGNLMMISKFPDKKNPDAPNPWYCSKCGKNKPRALCDDEVPF